MFSVESILFKDTNTTNNMVVNKQTSLKSTDEIYKDAAQAMEDLEFYNTYSKLSTYNNLQKLKMVRRLHGVTQNIRNKQANNSCESYLSNLAYSIEEDQKNGEENKGEEKKEDSGSSGSKDGNIIVRFFRWIKNLLKRFGELLKSIWNKIVGFFKKEKKNFDKEVKGETAATVEKENITESNDSIVKLMKTKELNEKQKKKCEGIKTDLDNLTNEYGGVYVFPENLNVNNRSFIVVAENNVNKLLPSLAKDSFEQYIDEAQRYISEVKSKIESVDESNKMDSAINLVFLDGKKEKATFKKVDNPANLSIKQLFSIISSNEKILDPIKDTIRNTDNLKNAVTKFTDAAEAYTNKKYGNGKALSYTEKSVKKENYSSNMNDEGNSVQKYQKGQAHNGVTVLKNFLSNYTKTIGKYTNCVNIISKYVVRCVQIKRNFEELEAIK